MSMLGWLTGGKNRKEAEEFIVKHDKETKWTKLTSEEKAAIRLFAEEQDEKEKEDTCKHFPTS